VEIPKTLTRAIMLLSNNLGGMATVQIARQVLRENIRIVVLGPSEKNANETFLNVFSHKVVSKGLGQH
jgi:non-homologous end joining protein Ku